MVEKTVFKPFKVYQSRDDTVGSPKSCYDVLGYLVIEIGKGLTHPPYYWAWIDSDEGVGCQRVVDELAGDLVPAALYFRKDNGWTPETAEQWCYDKGWLIRDWTPVPQGVHKQGEIDISMITPQFAELVLRRIRFTGGGGPHDVDEIVGLLGEYPEANVRSALDYLRNEGKIAVDASGQLTVLSKRLARKQVSGEHGGYPPNVEVQHAITDYINAQFADIPFTLQEVGDAVADQTGWGRGTVISQLGLMIQDEILDRTAEGKYILASARGLGKDVGKQTEDWSPRDELAPSETWDEDTVHEVFYVVETEGPKTAEEIGASPTMAGKDAAVVWAAIQEALRRGMVRVQNTGAGVTDRVYGPNYAGDVGKRVHFTKRATIKKLDAPQQIAYAEVYVAENKADAQGDWMTPEDVRKMAHDYMLKSRKLGEMHERMLKDDEAAIVETWFQDAEHPVWQRNSWVMGVKVFNKNLWDKIEKGIIKGFSIGGDGMRLNQEPGSFAKGTRTLVRKRTGPCRAAR